MHGQHHNICEYEFMHITQYITERRRIQSKNKFDKNLNINFN